MKGKKELRAETMECTSVPSLEYQALFNIAVRLWNHETFRYDVRFPSDEIIRGYLDKQLGLIERHINRLPLPKLIKNELLRFSAVVGMEVFKWNEYHLNKYDLEISIPRPLCWELSGIINYKKTAELLIQDLTVGIYPRFFLACMYGLEDSIKELWLALPGYFQTNLLHSNADFVFYWANELTDYVHDDPLAQQLDRFFNEDLPLCVFQTSIRMCDTPVSEYIFQKLRPEDKLNLPNLFEETANTICELFPRHAQTKFVYPDVLCWLLHKLDEQQREKMYETHPFAVLLCYLEWPKQELFIEMAQCLLQYLSGKHFGFLLMEIASRAMHIKDFNYRKLFRHFWQQSLESHKEYVLGESSCWCALYSLFIIGDVHSIKMVFEKANDAQKMCFLNSKWGRHVEMYLHCMGEKDLLDFFFKTCLPSRPFLLPLLFSHNF